MLNLLVLGVLEVENQAKQQTLRLSVGGLPGAETAAGPCRSTLHPTRASQLPYDAKSDFMLIL